MERPFFDVQVGLDVPAVAMSPDLDDIQQASGPSLLSCDICDEYG